MILKMYSIYDNAAKTFNKCMFFSQDGEALRALIQEVNREDSMLCKHPEDYTMFRLGMMDTDNGEIIPETPEKIAFALEYKEGSLRKDKSVKSKEVK